MPFHPPSEFAAQVVNSGDSVCEALAKVFRVVQMTSDNQAYIFNEDGSFTTAYTNRVCATGCGGGGSSTTGGGSESLTAVVDLSMPIAYRHYSGEPYRLRWTKPTGVTSFSVYRNTVNNPATATLILAPTVPDDATVEWLPVSGEPLYDCGDYILFLDYDFSGTSDNDILYYWVVGHDGSGNYSEKSNVASGRRYYNYTYYTFGSLAAYINPASPYVVPGGFSKFVFSLFGAGGGGGGGSLTNAGGGAGGGGVLIGEVSVSAGNEFYAEFTTPGSGGGNSANGTAGGDAVLYYRAANGDPWIEVARAVGGGGGIYNGAGGSGGSSTYDGTYFQAATQFTGIAGSAASGGNGGYTGADYYFRRWPQGTNAGVPSGGYYGSYYPGGGSDRASNGSALPFATGGNGGLQGEIYWGFVV